MKTKTNETVEQFIKQLSKDNPNGGSITLDDICSKVKNIDRWTLVSHLKKNKDGVFVTGRRGRKSRFVYGEPAEIEQQKIEYQSNRRKLPRRRSLPASEGQIIELKGTVEINGESVTLPIRVRVVEAEAIAA